MPYHVKSVGVLGTGDVYYKGNDQWTQVYADRKQYSNKSDADAVKATRENSKFTKPSGETIKTYTYQPKIYANATVVTE